MKSVQPDLPVNAFLGDVRILLVDEARDCCRRSLAHCSLVEAGCFMDRMGRRHTSGHGPFCLT